MNLIGAFAAAACGILAGAISGVVPGLHANTLQPLLAELGLPLPPDALAVLFCSLAFSRLAFEAIPSILLFIPSSDSIAPMLPGHRLAVSGKADAALKIHAVATLSAAAIACVTIPLAVVILPVLYESAKPFTPLALSLSILLCVASERSLEARAGAAACALAAGALGIAVFSAGLSDPFLPLFSGLFAVPAAIASLSTRPRSAAPAEPANAACPPVRSLAPLILGGTALGLFAELFPGMGSAAQLSLFVAFAFPLAAEEFLCLSAAVSASHLAYSFASAASTGRARTGTAVAIAEQLGGIGAGDMPLLAGAALAAAAVSCAAIYSGAHAFSHKFSRVDSGVLSLSVLAFLPAAAFILSGWGGLCVLAAAAVVGSLPLAFRVKRIHLMGALLVPALLQSI